MKGSQLIVVLGSLLLLFMLYFFGRRIPNTQNHKAEVVERGGTIMWDDSVVLAKEISGLSNDDKKTLQALSITDTMNRILFWKSRSPMAVALAYKGIAMQTNAYAYWDSTGDWFNVAHHKNDDTTLQKYLSENIISAYQKGLSVAKDSMVATVKLAEAYINVANETMQGVQLLLGVVEKDANNIKANLILGNLAMVSGQYDKARKRLSTVLERDSTHVEAAFLLAQTYHLLGDDAKAIELFEFCKTIVQNDQFHEEMNRYIQSIKKSL